MDLVGGHLKDNLAIVPVAIRNIALEKDAPDIAADRKRIADARAQRQSAEAGRAGHNNG